MWAAHYVKSKLQFVSSDCIHRAIVSLTGSILRMRYFHFGTDKVLSLVM